MNHKMMEKEITTFVELKRSINLVFPVWRSFFVEAMGVDRILDLAVTKVLDCSGSTGVVLCGNDGAPLLCVKYTGTGVGTIERTATDELIFLVDGKPAAIGVGGRFRLGERQMIEGGDSRSDKTDDPVTHFVETFARALENL